MNQTQDVNSQLATIQKMLAAYLRHEGLMQWVDGWAAGQNEGGVYVSLFNGRAAYRICNVYSEDFHKLPDFIRDQIPPEVGHEIGTERARVESKGYLIGCPLFAITRYKLAKDDDKDKWRFGDVIYSAQASRRAAPSPRPPADPTAAQPVTPITRPAAPAVTPAPATKAQPAGSLSETTVMPPPAAVAMPQPAPSSPTKAQPPSRLQNRPDSFTGRDGAIAWAVAEGAYPTAAEAGAAYDQVKRVNAPHDAPTMWQLWIGAVENQVYRNAQPA